jgi:opacity protein-like surface antigen
MKLHPLVTAAALAAACCTPALAATFVGASTQNGTVVTDYAAPGLVSFDIDFADLAAAELNYRIDADDIGLPIELNMVLRNFTLSGIDGYRLQLNLGHFASIGTVTRQFGGSTQIAAGDTWATLAFSPPEYLDVEVGNALGSTAGAVNWTLAGLQAGDVLRISVSAVPEPAVWLLMLAGMGGIAMRAGRARVG